MNQLPSGFISVILFSISLLLVYRVARSLRESGEDASRQTRVRHFPILRSDGDSAIAGFDRWFNGLCYFVGGGLNPLAVVLGIGLLALLCGGLVAFLTGDGFLAVMVASSVVALSVCVLVLVRRRALKQFSDQFPAALDLFSRAIGAGESVDQAMHLLAKAQIGDVSQAEFGRCAGHLDMGLSLNATLNSLCDRIGLADVRIFSSAMIAHRDGGGNLSVILNRLAGVIRDRNNYRRQLKAVTGASRISVMLIAILGPILFGWLFLVHPEYGAGMWQDATGRMMLAYAIVSEVIGLIVVGYLLRTDY